MDYIQVTEKPFIDYVIDESVFVYGTALKFKGSSITGLNATVIITGGLAGPDLNEGSSIAVSNIYVDGDVTLSGGSVSLGSPDAPGKICINGDLTLTGGNRDVYGDVYVNGDFDLSGATIHGNVYVDGDLTLEWGAPTFADGAHIYYSGTFNHPPTMSQTVLDKCIHNTTVPELTIPDLVIPPAKPEEWYTDKQYATGGLLTSGMKIYADSYSSTSWRPSATDVIIIARDGDITITGMGSSDVTGIFFAPEGRVTFNGGNLEGVVIARDGLFVESGGTKVTFKNISDYIPNPDDYPF
ncbi:MAG: hypothetical protein GX885_06645 [Methanomicrobiales archaeon]|nr:hypothetical protein [Methanomicrobiales archaeon]